MNNEVKYIHTDNYNRFFNYSLINNKSNKLIIIFTGFLEDSGGKARKQEYFDDFFDGLNLFKNIQNYNYLFLCDEFGCMNNGSYYSGYKGDFFVERAVDLIIDKIISDLSISKDKVITLGSFMGGYAALKYAIQKKFAGAIALSPYIYLDVCAKYNNREDHVKYLLPDENTQSPYNFSFTRKISNLVNNLYFRPLPRIFIHCNQEEYGTYNEQVLPFLNEFNAAGGRYDFSYQTSGAHKDIEIGIDALLYLFDKYFYGLPLEQKQFNEKLNK